MNVETFFEKFEVLAAAPDAVARMRALVLQLAVNGKLVAQDSHDEPASELLNRAKKEMGDADRWQRVLAATERARAESETEYGSLPQGWEWACNALLGDTSPRNNASDNEMVAFAPMNLIPTDYRQQPKFEVRPWGEIKKGYTHFANGDIAVAKITPCFQNGKACVMENLHGGLGAGTTELHVLRPFRSTVVPLYMLMVYTSPSFVAGGVATFSGTAGQQRVSNEYFRSTPIPLPPLAEQKRIVAKVDELMALCDRLEAQQAEREARHTPLARAALARFAETPTPANLEYLFHPSYAVPPADLRKSILTLAVQGKLVPQDPNDEPAEVLLARIKKRDAQESGRRKRSQSDLAFTTDQIPFELPSGWAWERLGNIGETNIGLTYSPQDVSDVGIPVLRSGNIQNGKLDFDDLVRVNCEPKQSVMVQDGDLLICARNGSRALVGKVALIESLEEPAAFGAFMAIYRSEVNSYLYHFIRSPLFRQMIDEVNTTTINQITQSNLRSTLAPIPPLAEQRRIVAKVKELMSLVDQLEAQLAAAHDTGERLMEAIVSELTTPEPASCP